MAKNERLVLVDGSWLVFRAFFGLPSNLSRQDGLHTNAIFGFALMFRKLFGGRAPDRGAAPRRRRARSPSKAIRSSARSAFAAFSASYWRR